MVAVIVMIWKFRVHLFHSVMLILFFDLSALILVT